MTIKSPKCQHENPDGTIYCGKCAEQLLSPEDIKVTETIETPKEELTRGTTFAGRYEIIEELGRGGMGKVYRVEDTELKQEVALKLIRPEIATDKNTIERFRNELKTARTIRHKNVCGMFDLGEAMGRTRSERRGRFKKGRALYRACRRSPYSPVEPRFLRPRPGDGCHRFSTEG